MSNIHGELQEALGSGFTVERELGRGGMGTVYLARDLQLDRHVAVKVLLPELAARQELRERFLRESRTTASFSHPHIVPVHGVLERPGMLGFVMGYIEGETLTSRVRRDGPLLAADAVRVLREVAWGLAYAAGRGIIHRDVKPDNILLERATGRALLTDFGIARSDAATALTGVGQVVGTPHYMSPEQAAGDTIDGRSDIYSLGAVAWFALTGSPPFEAPSAGQVLAMHMTAPLPSLAALRPDLPRPLVELVERSLAKEPADRYQAGEEVVTALEPVTTFQRTVPVVLRAAMTRLRVVSLSFVTALVLGPVIAWRMHHRGASVDAAVVLAFSLACEWGLLSNIWHGFRTLAAAGFQHADLRNAINAIESEGDELQLVLRMNPSLMRRMRRVELVAWLILGVGIIGVSLAVARMRELAGGAETLNRPGIITLVASTIMIALAMTTLLTVPARPTRLRRAVMSFWAGRFGASVFRLFTRGRPVLELARPITPEPGGRRGAITVFESLDPAQRRALRQVPGHVERLEAESQALGARVRDLQATLVEAGPPTPPGAGDTPVEAARERLREEVGQALGAARERRAAITTMLEELRLELLRVKSGVAGDGAIERLRAKVGGQR